MALNRREKALLSLPVLMGGLMGFYNWVHEPLFQHRSEVTEQYNQEMTELRKDENRRKQEGDLNQRRTTVTAREQTIDAWVPGKNSAALLIWYLSQAETHSGARITSITVGDRQTVSVSGAAPVAGGVPAPGGEAKAPAQTAEKSPPPSTGLTTVRLDMKVDAHFAEHLLFNQSMEQMPLFLNATGLSLKRAEKAPLDLAGKMIADGRAFMAGQILRSSPVVEGTYQVHLYFKTDKAGPATSPMQFADGAGRMDPFAMNGVDEFVQSVLDFFSAPRDSLGSDYGSGRYRSPGYSASQLG